MEKEYTTKAIFRAYQVTDTAETIVDGYNTRVTALPPEYIVSLGDPPFETKFVLPEAEFERFFEEYQAPKAATAKSKKSAKKEEK